MTVGVTVLVVFVILVFLRALSNRGTDPVGQIAAAFTPSNGAA